MKEKITHDFKPCIEDSKALNKIQMHERLVLSVNNHEHEISVLERNNKEMKSYASRIETLNRKLKTRISQLQVSLSTQDNSNKMMRKYVKKKQITSSGNKSIQEKLDLLEKQNKSLVSEKSNLVKRITVSEKEESKLKAMEKSIQLKLDLAHLRWSGKGNDASDSSTLSSSSSQQQEDVMMKNTCESIRNLKVNLDVMRKSLDHQLQGVSSEKLKKDDSLRDKIERKKKKLSELYENLEAYKEEHEEYRERGSSEVLKQKLHNLRQTVLLCENEERQQRSDSYMDKNIEVAKISASFNDKFRHENTDTDILF